MGVVGRGAGGVGGVDRGVLPGAWAGGEHVSCVASAAGGGAGRVAGGARFVRLRMGDEPTVAAGPAGSHRSGGRDGCVGANPRNAKGDVEVRGDGDVPEQARPVVVRFAGGVEVHIDARQLGEVLSCLRDGSADGRSP